MTQRVIFRRELVLENLASRTGIMAKIGYKRRPRRYGGKLSKVVDNSLSRHFDIAAPNKHGGPPSSIAGHRAASCLSSSGDRPLLAPLGQLVDAEPPNNRPGFACPADGGVAQDAQGQAGA